MISTSNRKKRMTKAEVIEFVSWCFADIRYNDLINWTSSKIINEYKKYKDIDLSPQFVNLQRRTWIMKDGKLRKINN